MGSRVRTVASGIAVALALCGPLATPASGGAYSPLFLEPGRWETEVRQAGVDPDEIRNPIAFDAEMRDLAREIATADTARGRLRQIQQFLFRRDEFRFRYDSETTLTAREAFETRSGNCVSFTNLFIALARSIDIPVQAALVFSRGDPEMDGDLIVVNNHIVAAHRRVDSTALFDFNRLEDRKLVGYMLIDDLWTTAVYLNNLGTRRLRSGDLEGAAEILESSLLLAPRFSAAYGNLGVVRRRLGDQAGAWDAYIRGLRCDRHEATIWNNVRRLVEDLAHERMRSRGWTPATLPYDAEGLVLRGDLTMVRGHENAARKLYREAAKAAPRAADPPLHLARLQLLRGRWSRAERNLRHVLELEPGHPQARALIEIVRDVRGR